MERDLVAGEQRIDEGVVLLARERAIDVVGAGAAGPGLVVARLEPGLAEIDRVAMHDRRDGVEKGELRLRRSACATVAARSGEVSGPVATMTLSQSSGGSATSPRSSVISGCASSAAVTAAEKPSRSTASAPPAGTWLLVGRAHDQRAEPAHFRMQQADRVVVLVVGAERVRADQFGKAVGLVGGRLPQRPHLVQRHRHAGLRQLPGGLRAGQAAADDMDGFQGHGRKLGAPVAATAPKRNRPRQARAVSKHRLESTLSAVREFQATR